VVEDLLTPEHILYHLVFAESNVDNGMVIFADDSTFSLVHGRLILV
jgi:hypothetical protein